MMPRISSLLRKFESNEFKKTSIIDISSKIFICVCMCFSLTFLGECIIWKKPLVKIRIFYNWLPDQRTLSGQQVARPGPSRNVQAACAEPRQQVNTASDRFIFISCLNSLSTQVKSKANKGFYKRQGGVVESLKLRFIPISHDPPVGGPRPS